MGDPLRAGVHRRCPFFAEADMRLFHFELAWAHAAYDAILPEGSALPHGLVKVEPERLLADAIARSPFEQALGLRLTVWMIALAPLWLLRRPKTIGSLEPDERQRVLERLLASRIYAVRQLTAAFKAIAAMFYSLSPAARAAMNLPQQHPFESGIVSLRPKRARAGEAHEHAAE
jgi:hypothetical protein